MCDVCNWTLRNSLWSCVSFFLIISFPFYLHFTFLFAYLIFFFRWWINIFQLKLAKILQWWYTYYFFYVKRLVEIFTNYYVSNFICVHISHRLKYICFKLNNGSFMLWYQKKNSIFLIEMSALNNYTVILSWLNSLIGIIYKNNNQIISFHCNIYNHK